jgi:hypothetical protein
VGLLVLGVIFFLCIAALLKKNSLHFFFAILESPPLTIQLIKRLNKFELNVLAIRWFNFDSIIKDCIVWMIFNINVLLMRKFDQLSLYYLRCTSKHEKFKLSVLLDKNLNLYMSWVLKAPL